MTTLFIIKFGSDRIRTVGGVAFWYPHQNTADSKAALWHALTTPFN